MLPSPTGASLQSPETAGASSSPVPIKLETSLSSSEATDRASEACAPDAKAARVEGASLASVGVAVGSQVEVLWDLEGENGVWGTRHFAASSRAPRRAGQVARLSIGSFSVVHAFVVGDRRGRCRRRRRVVIV